jgi:hypothetical protein
VKFGMEIVHKHNLHIKYEIFFCKSTITNMGMVQHFDVISNNLSVKLQNLYLSICCTFRPGLRVACEQKLEVRQEIVGQWLYP